MDYSYHDEWLRMQVELDQNRPAEEHVARYLLESFSPGSYRWKWGKNNGGV